MKEPRSETESGGVGFLGLLTLLFIGLKLGNVIDWSWWWVLAPLWAPFALVLVLLAFFIVIIFIREAAKLVARLHPRKGRAEPAEKRPTR